MTPSSQLEKVARALWEDWRRGKTCRAENRGISWEQVVEGAELWGSGLQDIVDDARSQAQAAILAVLESIREPDTATLAKGVPAFAEVEEALKIAWIHGFQLTAKTDDPPLKQAFRAMIDHLVARAKEQSP